MSPEVAAKFKQFEDKMVAEGLSGAAILAFKNSYAALSSGSSGMITEDSIEPAADVPYLEGDIKGKHGAGTDLLAQTVVLKLNGGLGTSMGLDKAKSLLKVKGDDTFLDLTAKQVMHMRKKFASNVKFILMNSFSTSEDTLAFLQKYHELSSDPNLELLQNKVPKVDAATMEPAAWPKAPAKEWCPPGHGDLYAALSGSGVLDKLLAEGVKYMFVSNSDNLGATLDMDLLAYLAASDKPFVMEVCERTEADKKGGHLAVRKSDSRLILRESAQCDGADEKAFQDTGRHRFFNTNNLWIRLDRLKDAIAAAGGLIPLPMIKNPKTVDPQDDKSTPVLQLETAMGAAIECFEGAGAVVVPRTRFAPVKKCSDLLLLRSDAYVVNDAYNIVLAPEVAGGAAPLVDLDSKKFKLVQQLDAATARGVPSLIACERFTVKGLVALSARCIIKGDVTVKNTSDEVKTLAPREYKDETCDLTDAPGLGPLKPSAIATEPIAGQKPGTSGLRKPTKTFMAAPYLHNFVQATFDALKATGTDVTRGTLLLGGDGRYFNNDAIQIILKIAAANGVTRVWVGQDGLLSTPACSAIIREKGPLWQKAFGAFILTASHNPGGPNEDFGIKYNCENGGPALEALTNLIYKNTTAIGKYAMCEAFPTVDITKLGVTKVAAADGSASVTVEVISSTDVHVSLLKSIFDFEAIKALIARPDFTFVYDSMSGVQGPYAKAVFVDELGAPATSLLNATPKDDFGGGHADPNLTYAHDLVASMGLNSKGAPLDPEGNKKDAGCCLPHGAAGAAVPCFGAAADGDADRNMILGRRFFVTPSDSVAIIAAHADAIPYFSAQGGLRGVARSMPTSGALDLVAKKLGLKFFETPTGWKFFGNLMDSKALGGEDFAPFICGEESFGTGSDHIREKDGMWAVLAWLSILAHYNADHSAQFVHVEDIVRRHWKTYGRNYYSRYDYEGVDLDGANQMMDHLRAHFAEWSGATVDGFSVALADEFTYHDPVDASVSANQGIRILMADGSRVVFRLSGTGSVGATIRMYIEKYESDAAKLDQAPADALAGLVALGLKLSKLTEFTKRESPTVIT
ncbi:UTP--glucose-1-phosphate uridylyltransferase-domain-containing protein [Tribonema minus]|uniref:UTP--glucose-1-phosphate uridylyltransferase-domain-containing protein n=1 Tax=Tribonema minus TaxID=303371 RepID=A0A836CGV2_9STRA|nr:UTP--glucose-1-phosphate uridylyltransferase-domain-containing protein [Tribonema minus]